MKKYECLGCPEAFKFLIYFYFLKDTETFPLLGHSSDVCNSQGWIRPKPGNLDLHPGL